MDENLKDNQDTNHKIPTKLEIEPYGVEYERFALHKLFNRLTQKYGICKVAEIPAMGAKAMPSLYSVGFAMAGAAVTLVNGDPKMKKHWQYAGLSGNVSFIKVNDIFNTGLEPDSFDLVWNFNVLPAFSEKKLLMKEMNRLTRKYLLYIHVNGYNVGFPFHRFAHKLTNIPWTHGDIKYNKPRQLLKIFNSQGFQPVEVGVVDCPCWPDSLGFRDIRLHRQDDTGENIEWKSSYLDWVKNDEYPSWLGKVYLLERLPIPLWLKYPYAHLFYVIIKKKP